MKIENKEISIKIGNKTQIFKNLILDSYLNLFADSFLSFKSKSLPYCLVNFTKNNGVINEQSTSMEYDTVLCSNAYDNAEVLAENSVINKYYYINPLAGQKSLSDFSGKQIKELGFADYSYNLYAFIDVSKYNLFIQDNQPVIISRIDKITSDMNFWSSSRKIKGPLHLTNSGLKKITTSSSGTSDISTEIARLYSVGFGFLPYKISKEYLVEDLTLQRGECGEVEILGEFGNYKQKELYPSKDLYPSENLYPKKSTYNFLMYKFVLGSGAYYIQYKELDKYGQFNKLKIKYKRG